jgi:hypothetical protein
MDLRPPHRYKLTGVDIAYLELRQITALLQCCGDLLSEPKQEGAFTSKGGVSG